ncbi:MAG: J domain-containing protein [Bacillota bacterium]
MANPRWMDRQHLMAAYAARDYYAFMDLPRTASKPELKRRYRELARVWHPDCSTGDAAIMQLVNAVKDVLLNDAERYLYDQGFVRREQAGPSAAGPQTGASQGSRSDGTWQADPGASDRAEQHRHTQTPPPPGREGPATRRGEPPARRGFGPVWWISHAFTLWQCMPAIKERILPLDWDVLLWLVHPIRLFALLLEIAVYYLPKFVICYLIVAWLFSIAFPQQDEG